VAGAAGAVRHRLCRAVRPPGGRAAGGFEQVHPVLLAVPALGQVQGDLAAAVAGDPGGYADQVPADGGAAGGGVEQPG